MLKYIVFLAILLPKIVLAEDMKTVSESIVNDDSMFHLGYYIGRTRGLIIGSNDTDHKMMQFIEGYQRGIKQGYYVGAANNKDYKEDCIGIKNLERYTKLIKAAAEKYPHEEFNTAILKTYKDLTENKCSIK